MVTFSLSLVFAVTGACFFVFSGALKASSGYLAKTSIVEGENYVCGPLKDNFMLEGFLTFRGSC